MKLKPVYERDDLLCEKERLIAIFCRTQQRNPSGKRTILKYK
jgi:hypothetical protein